MLVKNAKKKIDIAVNMPVRCWEKSHNLVPFASILKTLLTYKVSIYIYIIYILVKIKPGSPFIQHVVKIFEISTHGTVPYTGISFQTL